MENHTKKLSDISVASAVEVLNLVQQRNSRHETILCNRIGRAGKRIGANIHEARYAHGKADFVSEPQIALKEANETSYWLLLLARTDMIGKKEFDQLENLCKPCLLL